MRSRAEARKGDEGLQDPLALHRLNRHYRGGEASMRSGEEQEEEEEGGRSHLRQGCTAPAHRPLGLGKQWPPDPPGTRPCAAGRWRGQSDPLGNRRPRAPVLGLRPPRLRACGWTPPGPHGCCTLERRGGAILRPRRRGLRHDDADRGGTTTRGRGRSRCLVALRAQRGRSHDRAAIG